MLVRGWIVAYNFDKSGRSGLDMKTIDTLHEKEFGVRPQIIGEVPGVCTLFGNFSDLCEGWAVIGTSNGYVRLAVSKRDDGMVRLYNATSNDRKRFSLNSLKYRKEDRWGNFIKGVISVLAGENYRLEGMDITCDGPVLLGDMNALGTALCMATCITLNQLYGLGLSSQDLIRDSYRAMVGFNQRPCRICYLVTMLHCPPGKVLFFDLDTMGYQEIDFPFGSEKGDCFAVLLESKISQGAMREEVNIRRDDTKAALAELKRLHLGSGAIREFPEKELHNRQVKMAEPKLHICSYVLMESQESVLAAKLLKLKDARALGKVMNRVQSGLRDLMEVTCPETDWLAKRAGETQGCFGAMQVYDGMAGNMLMLFDKPGWDRYQPRLEDYGHIFGFHPKWHIYQSPGSMQITYPR